LNGGFDRTALEKLIHYAYTARYSCDLRGRRDELFVSRIVKCKMYRER
jgi:hypothetical protein